MNRRRMRGFTIAEMAVVVVIMAVVMASSLKLLNTQVSNAGVQQTREKQADVRRALIQFLRSNGRLPCPDTKSGVATPPDGLEVAPCSGAAAQGYGVVPWQTLGLGRDRAIDAWGSFMAYRVANGSFPPTLSEDWTSNTLLNLNANTFSIRNYAPPFPVPTKTNILVQERNPADPAFALVPVTPEAVVVLLSYGKSAWGSVRQSGAVESISTKADEAQNATAPFDTFVTRPQTVGSWGLAGGEFDDILMYLKPVDLIDPLISEKTLLGTCKAYCLAPAPGCLFSAVPIGINAGTCLP